jgi:hypothetical protein
LYRYTFYGDPDKHIKLIRAKYKNNLTASKLEIIKSGAEQGCVISPFIRTILMDFFLMSTSKVMKEHRNEWGIKSPNYNNDNDLIILDENDCKRLPFSPICLGVNGKQVVRG